MGCASVPPFSDHHYILRTTHYDKYGVSTHGADLRKFFWSLCGSDGKDPTLKLRIYYKSDRGFSTMVAGRSAVASCWMFVAVAVAFLSGESLAGEEGEFSLGSNSKSSAVPRAGVNLQLVLQSARIADTVGRLAVKVEE
ncbi:hypothetical protein Bbelb_139770 [Branchiostoma belcheri]|nr:hypothetical protein Bbelb_139770 [Branchiostoma belcheri]